MRYGNQGNADLLSRILPSDTFGAMRCAVRFITPQPQRNFRSRNVKVVWLRHLHLALFAHSKWLVVYEV